MTGGRYSKVMRAFWYEPQFRGLGDDARTLAMYLATCPHGNSEGLYRLPLPFMWHELGWDGVRTSAALEELADRWLAFYDTDAEIVFATFVLEWDKPAGPKQVKGAVTKLAEVPGSPLRLRYLEHAREVCPKLAEAIETTLDWVDGPHMPPDPPAEDEDEDEDLAEAEAQDAAGAATDAELEDEETGLVEASTHPAAVDSRTPGNSIDTVSMGYSEFSTPHPHPLPSPHPSTPSVNSRARPPERWGPDQPPLENRSDDANALAVAALARMRIARPSTPTSAEVDAIAGALASGWTASEILEPAATAGRRPDIGHPRRWALTAWRRLAGTDAMDDLATPIAPAPQPPARYHPTSCSHGCSAEGWIDGPNGLQRCPGDLPAAGAWP